MSRKRRRNPRPASPAAPRNPTPAPRTPSPPPPPPPPEAWSTVAIAAACGLGAIALYVTTAARDIVLGDSAELAAVVATLGVAHPPGYPLLTLIGHLLAVTGPGPLPFRANLISVLAGGVSVSLVFLAAYRLTRNSVASVGAAVLLAVQPLVWEWSLVIETFALNACLTLGVLYALMRWDEDARNTRWLTLAAFVTGLGMANHHTSVVVAAPALVALWLHRAELIRRPAIVATAALALLPGFLLYAYVPWAAARQPALNWGDVSSFSGLVAHFLRASYGTLTLSATISAPSSSPELLGAFASTFLGVEALLVAGGLVLAYRSSPRTLWTLGLAAAIAGPVFAVVSKFDLSVPGYAWVLERFFVLPHVLLAPLAGLTLAEGSVRLGELLSSGQKRFAAVGIGVAVAAIAGIDIHSEYGQLDQRQNHLARTFATDILASLPQHAVLLSNSDVVTLPVAYLQAVEGARPDVTQLMLGPLSRGDWYVGELRSGGLRIPFDHYDGSNESTSVRAIVDANPDRTFVLVGPPIDGSLEPDYWFLPKGLTLVIEPKNRDVALADMDADNTRLFATYHPPSTDVRTHENFDPYVLRAYATGARLVGLQYLANQRPDDAARWFKRALALDPSDDETKALLAK